LVVEAFKIPTGSMAPTLMGIHKEVLCSNCGWTFRVGRGRGGEAKCPNCLDEHKVGGREADVVLKRPAWLWHEGRDSAGKEIAGADAANRAERWGSRIFVNKFIYLMRRPKRWEVIVFAYPHPGENEKPRNYIKRLVGLPGETIVLENGDVYVNGKIAPKPPAVQRRLWQHVLDTRFAPLHEVEKTWNLGDGGHLWWPGPKSGSLRLEGAEEAGPVMASFARDITDSCAYNGGDKVRHQVGDVRVEARLTVLAARPGAKVVLRIEEDDHDFRLLAPLAGGKAILMDGEEQVAESDALVLPSGKEALLCLENYDDRVVASFQGRQMIVYEYGGNSRPEHAGKRVAFGASGAEVMFHRVKIERDIYYRVHAKRLDAKPITYVLDSESYFVLGDNSPTSRDSREWGHEDRDNGTYVRTPEVPAANILGQAVAIFWPVQDIGPLSWGTE
ncbi:MAG: signal peptidase I, partial [Candidatus Brocadiia bacterium]|nr:signal peptidase I [Candidatus Brocadiia bacterium]